MVTTIEQCVYLGDIKHHYLWPGLPTFSAGVVPPSGVLQSSGYQYPLPHGEGGGHQLTFTPPQLVQQGMRLLFNHVCIILPWHVHLLVCCKQVDTRFLLNIGTVDIIHHLSHLEFNKVIFMIIILFSPMSVRWCPMGNVNVKWREHQHQYVYISCSYHQSTVAQCIWQLQLNTHWMYNAQCIITETSCVVTIAHLIICHYYRWSGGEGGYCGELGGGWIKFCWRLRGRRNWSKSATGGKEIVKAECIALRNGS